MSPNEKRIWTVIVITAVGMFIFLTQRAVEAMLNQSILIQLESVDNSMEQLDFPAVTICNHNQIYKPRTEKFMKQLNSSGYTEDEIQDFFHYLPLLTSPQQNLFVKTKVYDKMFQSLKIPLKTLMHELMQPCETLFGNCEFLGILTNCTTLFRPVESYKGFCCAFNYYVSPTIFDNINVEKCTKFYNKHLNCKEEKDCSDEKRIQKVSGSGIHTGLYFRLYLEPENYFGFINSYEGASILIHEPHDYPEYDIYELVVQMSKQVNVIVSGTKVENDVTIRQLSQERRNCIFDLEVPYKYSYQSCIASCKMKRFLKICSCVPYYYPDTCVNISKICDFSNMKCIRKNYVEINNFHEDVKLESGMLLKKCPCLQVCSKTKYIVYDEVSSIYQGLRHPFLERLPNSNRGSDFDFAKIYVYFQDYTFTKYKKRLSSPWYTTIGTLGAVLGLCLGGSFISLLEPIIQVFVTPCRIKYRETQRKKIVVNDRKNNKFFQKFSSKNRIKITETNPNISMLENDFKMYFNY
ncbi:pickpocket protein 28-like, partial [Leptopilina heterotoma]|uniref:pickpocket protein 28-like n=1 Tax=Leptopilina heterotoma TaxID=63436 RepID=UPI001CA8324F